MASVFLQPYSIGIYTVSLQATWLVQVYYHLSLFTALSMVHILDNKKNSQGNFWRNWQLAGGGAVSPWTCRGGTRIFPCGGQDMKRWKCINVFFNVQGELWTYPPRNPLSNPQKLYQEGRIYIIPSRAPIWCRIVLQDLVNKLNKIYVFCIVINLLSHFFDKHFWKELWKQIL